MWLIPIGKTPPFSFGDGFMDSKTSTSAKGQSNLTPLTKELFIPGLFVLFWSSGAIFVKLGLPYANPFIFLSLRFFMAMVIMWLLCLIIKPTFPAQASEWKNIILTGLLQQVGYQAFFFLSLDYKISPGLLSIILGAQPILTTVLMKNNANKNQWVGLALGMLGLILVVGHSVFSGTISTFGIICSLLSLASITFGTMLQKRITVSLPVNMTLQYTCSCMVFIILTAFWGSFNVNWTLQFWISLLWMVLIITVGATMLLYYMISKGNLTSVTSLFYCVPPLTSILDFFVFGGTLQITTLFGMLFIIIGLICINKSTNM